MDIIVVRTLELAAFKVVHQVAQERDGLRHRAALRFVFVLQEAYIVHCLALRCHNQAAVASAVWRWQRPRRLFRRGAAIVFFPSPIVWRCSGPPGALMEGAGRCVLPGVNRTGLKGHWQAGRGVQRRHLPGLAAT